MSEPTRYNLRPIFLDYTQTKGLSKTDLLIFGENSAYPDKNGGWVKYEEIARLAREVERLTKAGDKMAVAINLNDDVFDNYEKKLAQSAWNAAKEGKQP